ncbi:MAG: hypothetical protein KGQ37_03680 [Hyphomicrobiales bacterium]|nr:hypothetical protein [Hyphomicrobiales bacterium]
MASASDGHRHTIIGAVFRGYAAHFAALAGLDAGAALASDPGRRANASPEWRAAALVRAQALYCTVTELNVNGARVARAIGMTRQAVSQALRRIEDMRDDAAFDAALDAAAALISGRVTC